MRRGHFDDQSSTSATTIAETATWSGETNILQYGRVILLITQSFGVDAEGRYEHRGNARPLSSHEKGPADLRAFRRMGVGPEEKGISQFRQS
jgi:hypothetical protein